MSEKLEFVDTNILVYAYDVSTGEKHLKAKKLVKELWQQQSGCLSIQVLQEFFVNITRKIAYPMDSEMAEQIVNDLSTWRVHIPATTDVLEAIRLHKQYQIAFWDAMIVRSAQQSGCDVLWSEDLSAGQIYASVRVQTPF